MMSTEDLMGLVQMAASGMQSGGQPGAPVETGSPEGFETPDTPGRVSNKKLLETLESRISGVEDMLAQIMNAMGIQVPEKQMPMPESSPEDVAAMGAGGPPPSGTLPGGMPEPMPPMDMGAMFSPPMEAKTASQQGGQLKEALRRMRLINSYRE